MAPARRPAQPRARRAAARSAARRALAAQSSAPELTRPFRLWAASLRPRTQRLDLESWRSLADWSKERRLPPQSEKQIEDAIVDFVDFMTPVLRTLRQRARHADNPSGGISTGEAGWHWDFRISGRPRCTGCDTPERASTSASDAGARWARNAAADWPSPARCRAIRKQVG
ncbi:unnamed protein product [Prorocentrum cordatum]|uniref:Uncharacterized protein n=1 Tax=Prorocentrum cordatum TaxID=2364126 RepID=A0ABN9R509_9DINO|nr:unnamed protein product [Polarella glacialis]